MRELHIYDGVHALFANIGWERLLSADFATCPLVTREFLATLIEIETTNARKAKLFLLWCMIIGSHCPYFGDIIIKWFHRVIGIRNCGAIRYGGLITVIARSLTEQSPPGYTFFSADSFRLTLQTLRVMDMLRTTPGGYVCMRGRSTYFKVIGPDVIDLADPISNTMQVLPSNIPPPPRPRRAQQDMASLQQTMTGLRLDYQLYSSQVTDYRDELLGLRDDFDTFRDDFFRRYAPPSN
ncbi:unnamed protein product [Lactuca saligna]|uniref:Uncharacterized protein n=1 Tax=Lactuca saligna TaxID=75948 RepID=A0AA35ZUY8_LACSI|nr:unnamed protein product [Lactuca saligna]